MALAIIDAAIILKNLVALSNLSLSFDFYTYILIKIVLLWNIFLEIYLQVISKINDLYFSYF